MLYAWRLFTLLLHTLLHSRTVPHMLYAWRLHTLLHSYNKLPHMLYAWRLCTLWNSNDSPTHALFLKTLPSEAQTAVPYMLYASRLHVYPVQLKQQSHTCSMPQDYPLKLRHSNMQSHICSVSQDCMFTPWNSNNSPTHALCLKTCVPSETQTHALLWLVNVSLTHAL